MLLCSIYGSGMSFTKEIHCWFIFIEKSIFLASKYFLKDFLKLIKDAIDLV